MKSTDGAVTFSASDLTNFLACRHLTRLDRARADDQLTPRVQRDLGFEALVARGEEHEANVLAELRARGWDVVAMGDRFGDPALPADTLEALRSGVDVVYQGALQLDDEAGYPDFLVRSDLLDDDASDRSSIYEVVDAKLARTAKGRAVLQTTFYTRLLSAATGTTPSRMHLWLGHGEVVSYRVSDFAAYERQVAKLFHEFVAEDEGQLPPTDTYPDPTEHCQICRWRFDCTARRREDDDLSLIANIPARQRKALKDVGIQTMEAFVDLEELPPLPRVGADSLRGTHLQASLQVSSRRQGNAPLYELLEPERDAEDQLVPNRGFLGLPEPSPGDLFFDIEGARYYSEDAKEFGLQYLFGIVDSSELDDLDRPRFRAFWAFDRASEGEAFEQLVDFIEERRTRDPGLHVFHYNHYEPTQIGHLSDLHQRREEVLGRLMGGFGTREDEVDDMFRQSIFVDLFKVVRQSLRASVESYSIKRLERFTGYDRTVELEDANEHLIRFEAALDAGTARADHEGQRIVQGYNEDDCRSTLALRDWLEERRTELEERLGALPRLQPATTEAVVPDEAVEDLKRRLREGLPTDPDALSDVHRARSLMADLIEWFRREDKPKWWRYFFLRGLEDEQLLLQRDAIAGLEYLGDDRREKNAIISRYRFPEQEHSFEVGDALEDPTDEKGRKWKIDHVDHTHGELLLRRGPTLQTQPHPTALIAPGPEFSTNSQRARLRDLAEALIGPGDEVPRTAAFDLLLRRRPNVGGDQGEGLRRNGETSLEAGVRLAASLDGSYLPVQGPPGTGKTFTGASQILDLVRRRRKVGVMALSHAAIGHMLNQIAACARDTDTAVRIGQKPKSDGTGLSAAVAATGTDYAKMNAGQIADDLDSDVVDVVGGTSWLWSHEDSQGALDTLVVDEAGQLSLAFVLSCARAARNLILLGDPQQLAQPSQGTHPPGAGVSSLEHVLGDRAVIDPTMGLLIERTRRMHPDLTAFTSEVFYEGELFGLPELANQSVLRAGSLEGTGFRVLNVVHEANDNASKEEADLVSQISRAAMGGRWLDSDRRERTIDADGMLVVTPYNAQITEIGLAFEARGVGDLRVGTVDRFQGQEAPIVIYSTATSTAEDAPRGMEFLYDLHRLNVATSRARCIVVLVTNPELVRVLCRTPRQMQLANALCRLRELATPL